jgi:enoyl-CoA hydratase
VVAGEVVELGCEAAVVAGELMDEQQRLALAGLLPVQPDAVVGGCQWHSYYRTAVAVPTDPSLRVERFDGGVVGLWLDRPEKRNALDRALVTALTHAVEDRAVRAFVLGSAAQGMFSAGADLGLADAERASVSELLYQLYRRMLASPAPIIAAVSGAAVGGGAQLALASDIRVGGPDARLRFVGPGHGLAIGSWGLPSLVGRGRAMELCLSMRAVDADEALALGLLDRVEEDPRAAAVALAASIVGLDAAAVGRVKAVVRTASGVLDALEEERRGNLDAWSGAMR